ncbi:MAG: hypothetical protein WDW36_000944 [Sanguina aurantia]
MERDFDSIFTEARSFGRQADEGVGAALQHSRSSSAAERFDGSTGVFMERSDHRGSHSSYHSLRIRIGGHRTRHPTCSTIIDPPPPTGLAAPPALLSSNLDVAAALLLALYGTVTIRFLRRYQLTIWKLSERLRLALLWPAMCLVSEGFREEFWGAVSQPVPSAAPGVRRFRKGPPRGGS